jgi:hypothetical protein
MKDDKKIAKSYIIKFYLDLLLGLFYIIFLEIFI